MVVVCRNLFKFHQSSVFVRKERNAGQRDRHGDNLIARRPTARMLRKQTYVQIFGARPQLLSTEQIVVSLPVLSTAVSRVRRSESVVHNYRPLY